MAGRTGHIIQVILLSFIRMPPQQQVYIPDDRRKRSPYIMTDCQHHLLTAMQQVFGILFRLFQLHSVIFTFRNITGDHEDKNNHDNNRNNSNAGNQQGSLTQNLLFVLHTFQRSIHFLLLDITQNLVNLTGNYTIIITQISSTFQQLVSQQFTLPCNTVLQVFQHTGDGIRRIEYIHQSVCHYLAGRIDNDARVFTAG